MWPELSSQSVSRLQLEAGRCSERLQVLLNAENGRFRGSSHLKTLNFDIFSSMFTRFFFSINFEAKTIVKTC